MRTALFAVAAVTAAGLVVPTTLAVAGSTDPHAGGGLHYRDAAQARTASVSVTGTLTPIHSETGDEDTYAVSVPGGAMIPVSLAAHGDQHIEQPRPFRGTVAITDDLRDYLADRGMTVGVGRQVGGRTAAGRTIIAAAAASPTALPVRTATIGDEPTANSTTAAASAAPSAHRLYVAVITNRGSLDSDAAIKTKLNHIRSYWLTESEDLISSFTQATIVKYASSAAPSASQGCGLAKPTPVWNEAAEKFPDVDFHAAGNHLMVLVPNACGENGAAGIATVGASMKSGGRTMVTLGGTAVSIGVHELGHNLSLAHANAERCSSSCSTAAYWDLYSIMGLSVSGGSWTPPSLDTSYRMQLGIDDSSSVPTISASTTVHLAGRGTTSGTRGFLVTDPSSDAKYSVEYRSGTGRDEDAFYTPGRSLNGYSYRPGVVIERMESSDDSTTMMTQKSGDTYVTSFVEGERFTRGSLTIAVSDASPSAGADVVVKLPASSPPSSAAPSPSPSSSEAPSVVPSQLPSDLPSETPSPSPSTTAPAEFRPGTPGVRGTPRVGQRLVAATTSWSPTPERYSIQWLADGRALPKATRSSFVPSRNEYGKRISVVLTGYRDGYATTSRTSAATRPVAAGRFTSRTVRVTGRAKVGRTLRVATGTWQPAPSFTFRWYANGKTIAKAKGRTLKVTKSLRGKRISVRVTAWQYAYETTTKSARTGKVR